jgi:DNA-binding transcriptional LysR family regulator
MNVQLHKAITSITEADLRLMRIFRVVAESGGLTAAETKLRMERSTISRHIKALEERLGGQLCLRGPAGFELTDLGRATLRASITACDTLDHVRDQLNLARSVMTGDLLIGLADNCLSNPRARIVEAVAAFRAQAPGVQLHMSIRPPAQLLDDLTTRHLHLCVTGKPGDPGRFALQHLFDEEFRLYVGGAPDAPAPHADELERLGYVLVTRDGDPRPKALAARLKLSRQAVASGLEAVATFLASGGFVGFLPAHYASELSQSYRLREVVGAEASFYGTEFYLAHERSRPLSSPGRLFANLLTAAHEAPMASQTADARRSTSSF